MKSKLIGTARRLARAFGIEITRYRAVPPVPGDFDEKAASTIEHVRPYTMTSPERLNAFIQAVRYVEQGSVPGDIVECGVWRGGSMMAAARTLLEFGEQKRHLYLFDTFEGMSPPTGRDIAIDGTSASELLKTSSRNDPASAWCYASVEDVRSKLGGVGYDLARMHFIKGKVEDTIPTQSPERIAILRLDTDWYESTRHELEYLYPRLVKGGVLIIDDYGHWKGAREAVDEYLARHGIHILLNRIDYTGRIAVKPSD